MLRLPFSITIFHHLFSSPLLITMSAKASAIVVALASAMLLAACDYLPFGYTPIREITSAPGQFEGKEVKLKGRARGTLKFLGLKAYTLRDETGEVPVVTAGELPAENSEIVIKGVVKSAVIVGGSSLGLRVEEAQRLR
jgi:hypothetical protein